MGILCNGRSMIISMLIKTTSGCRSVNRNASIAICCWSGVAPCLHGCPDEKKLLNLRSTAASAPIGELATASLDIDKERDPMFKVAASFYICYVTCFFVNIWFRF